MVSNKNIYFCCEKENWIVDLWVLPLKQGLWHRVTR